MSILRELRTHSPFTIFGALTGVVLITFFQAMPAQSAYNVFYVLHPIHVDYGCGRKAYLDLLFGYFCIPVSGRLVAVLRQ